MLKDTDRSGYIGASDTSYVMGSWKSKSFRRWWQEKLGLTRNHFTSLAMEAGNKWEHKILRALQLPGLRLDEQYILEGLKLRVNLDGCISGCIKEVKTYRWEKGFTLPKSYIRQVQVQMFASGIHCADIVAYGLVEEDYRDFDRSVDVSRLRQYPIAYDPGFIEGQYLPRLRILARCLRQRCWPGEGI